MISSFARRRRRDWRLAFIASLPFHRPPADCPVLRRRRRAASSNSAPWCGRSLRLSFVLQGLAAVRCAFMRVAWRVSRDVFACLSGKRGGDALEEPHAACADEAVVKKLAVEEVARWRIRPRRATEKLTMIPLH